MIWIVFALCSLVFGFLSGCGLGFLSGAGSGVVVVWSAIDSSFRFSMSFSSFRCTGCCKFSGPTKVYSVSSSEDNVGSDGHTNSLL